MKLEYSKQIYEKNSGINYRENPSSGSRIVPCGQAKGQTDRHDDANSRLSTCLKMCQMEAVGLGFICTCISYLLYICVLKEMRFVVSSFLPFYILYIMFPSFLRILQYSSGVKFKFRFLCTDDIHEIHLAHALWISNMANVKCFVLPSAKIQVGLLGL
jgi:hypothetical protein